jgi:DNA topoisomerase-1
LQLGEQIKPPKVKKGEKKPEVEKPKRASIPKGISPENIDLEKALGLLALPREIGLWPDDGEPIVAGIGRFGPYVKHGKTYANLEEGDDVLTIGLNRAVTLIAEKKANPKKGRRFGADSGRVLGEHPDQGGRVVVKNGRYGPYVSHNGINATIPADKTPEAITLTEAVVLLDARADQLSAQPRRAAGRKRAGEPSEAPKGRKKKAEAADKGEKTVSSRKKPAKKAAKVTAAE